MVTCSILQVGEYDVTSVGQLRVSFVVFPLSNPRFDVWKQNVSMSVNNKNLRYVSVSAACPCHVVGLTLSDIPVAFIMCSTHSTSCVPIVVLPATVLTGVK
jgi:hypothetical protein